jgi:branched-chain amino acid aminotransferase
VVYLDAVEKKYIEELGGMNLFFVLGSGADAELVTPELSGTLLPGITRDSLITVAREQGHRVTERKVTLEEWRQGVADGSITETFACGTAAVITPVGAVKARSGDFVVGDGSPGPLTMKLRESLLDIQHGRVADTRGWLHRVA